MPVASIKPTTQVVPTPELPRVEPENYSSIIYDDNHVPLQSLIAFVEGAPWTGDYYAQVLSKHNELKEIDPGQQAAYQQYVKVTGLEIRVDQALSTTYDTGTGITSINGSGYIYPFMKPNEEDIFVADTSDNRKMMFRLTLVERKTFNRDSAWYVEYKSMGYIDDVTTKPKWDSLQEKTTKVYYFSKQRLLEGLSPTIKSEEYENVTNLRPVYEDLAKYYFGSFFNVKYGTLILPGQEYAIYDSGLVDYIRKIVETTVTPEMLKFKSITVDNDPYLTQPEFWKMLFDRDDAMRLRCNDVFGLANKVQFNNNTYLNGIRYSNIDYVIYPMNPDISANVTANKAPMVLSMEELITTESFKNGVYSNDDNTYTTDAASYPIIHEVLSDSKYVLSDAFYSDTVNKSVLEILVKDYIKHQSIDLKMLYACCNVFKKWKRLEQFYYGPILLTLLMESYRSQYT